MLQIPVGIPGPQNTQNPSVPLLEANWDVFLALKLLRGTAESE